MIDEGADSVYHYCSRNRKTEPHAVPPSRLLPQFLTIADRGSPRAAAVPLGVSQLALTRNFRRLERMLGVALFDRHSRGMALTAFGAAPRRRAGVQNVRAAEFAPGTTIVSHTAGGGSGRSVGTAIRPPS